MRKNRKLIIFLTVLTLTFVQVSDAMTKYAAIKARRELRFLAYPQMRSQSMAHEPFYDLRLPERLDMIV